MTAYAEFFLNRRGNVKALDTLEISHLSFSKVYWIVRNSRYGIDATLEDGVTVQHFDYYPVQIKGIASNQTLDQMLEVQLGDLGDILPLELDRVAADGAFSTKPVCKYRRYRSDDLSAPIDGPYTMEIINLPFNSQGSAFQATAPTINNNKTGEIYSLERFPMLKGFL